MAIAYPLTLPSSPGFVEVKIRRVNTVGQWLAPQSGVSQVYDWGGRWFEMDLALPPLVRADADAWLSVMMKLKGPFGTFYLGQPTGEGPRGTPAGTPVVAGAGQAGDSLATSGWTASAANVLRAGDYFGLAGNLYQVLDDVSADAGGLATLTIWPELRFPPADLATLTTAAPKGVFRLAAMPDEEISTALHRGLAFTAREVPQTS